MSKSYKSLYNNQLITDEMVSDENGSVHYISPLLWNKTNMCKFEFQLAKYSSLRLFGVYSEDAIFVSKYDTNKHIIFRTK